MSHSGNGVIDMRIRPGARHANSSRILRTAGAPIRFCSDFPMAESRRAAMKRRAPLERHAPARLVALRAVADSGSLHLDLPGTKLRALGNAHGQNPVLETRLDLSGLELATQREAAAIEARAQVGVERFRILGELELHLALDDQIVAIDAQAQAILRNARHVGAQGDAILVLPDVHRRPDRSLPGLPTLRGRAGCGLGCGAGAAPADFSVGSHVSDLRFVQWISIWRGRAASRRSTPICTTPSTYFACTRSGSTSSGRLMTRRNSPLKRSW